MTGMPAHWHPARAVPGYIARGFDAIAAEHGYQDGMALLAETAGPGADLHSAERWQFREWYYRAYTRYCAPALAVPDVVCMGQGITGHDSGWDAGGAWASASGV